MLEKLYSDAPKTEFGVMSSEINLQNLGYLSLPEKIRDEIPTANRQGFMKLELDEYSKHFVEDKSSGAVSIEIGGAYGFVAQEFLKKGKTLIEFELSLEHLMYTAKQTKVEHRDNLYLMHGSFPEDFSFRKNIADSLLASRILHFLRGEQIVVGLRKIYDVLVKGGKFFFTSVTPYHVAIKEGILPLYKERVKRGVKWPGEIENQWEINPGHQDYVQPFLHVFDVDELQKLLPEHGFRIDKISLFDYPNDTDSNGKGHVGFVATKV